MSSPEFYGANTQTPYPFAGPYNEVTAMVIDAQVVLPSGAASEEVLLTRFRRVPDISATLEISCGGVAYLTGAQVVVSGFGAYEIWQASAGGASVTLVVSVDCPPLDYTGTGYPFVEHVVTRQANTAVESVECDSQVIGVPGSTVVLQAGSNIRFSVQGEEGAQVITVQAEQRADGPCTPPELRTAPYITQVAGQAPDANGDLKLRGTGIWIVDQGTNGLLLINAGQECCSCDDYAALFERLLVTNARLAVTRDWIINNQYRYRVLLEYVKFLLRHEIVGGVDPESPDIKMTCE